ncbi:MAG: GerMN domain-containing protein [Candidatus Sericytochromatia bacterium]|uniref:GerMN domain-containing protein n=1 Tax=Candidatus Tanganyikabacteria bacterium TaxID=2961651 RepID=A0A938BNK9_9BACT|nr:GerMN domain-containing protein [Candidatus Tanganyikabacteria bacterium]MBM3778673.1 GerMN domain-containing protein [Acidimicrobiia bacterium]
MSGRIALALTGAVAVTGLGIWGLARALDDSPAPPPDPPPAVAEPAPEPPPEPDPAEDVAHIRATLYYGAAASDQLVPIRREVPLASAPADQARQVVVAQLRAAPAPLVSLFPESTRVRSVFVTGTGDAFVDLTATAATDHVGGLTAEILTVYSLVNALTSSLPSIRRVQLLIDGREVDSLAGHVDLREPLEPDLTLVAD